MVHMNLHCVIMPLVLCSEKKRKNEVYYLAEKTKIVWKMYV